MQRLASYTRLLQRSVAICALCSLPISSGFAGTPDGSEGYSRLQSRLAPAALQVGYNAAPAAADFPDAYIGGSVRGASVTKATTSAPEPMPTPMSDEASSIPALPPVAPEVVTLANRELEHSGGVRYDPLPSDPAPAIPPQEEASAPSPLLGNFVPPAPLVTTTPIENPRYEETPPAPQPMAILPSPLPEPTPAVAAAPSPEPVETLPAERLSTETRQIASGIPSKLDTKPSKKSSKMAVRRMTPELQTLINNTEVEKYDSVGLSIKVQRPGLDTNYELNRAYNAMIGGETSQAVDVYKNVLSIEPTNQDALFGLASLYHRNGDLERARPYYAKLLKLNPNHRDGLNNFLTLVSDEAPEEALAELERLEQRNPDFSPIPAQQALVLKRLGYLERAQDKLVRAIELSPENLSYKYNLAVLLDTSGKYEDASALYRLLIDSALKGEKLPVNLDVLQKRLNYIAAITSRHQVVGG